MQRSFVLLNYHVAPRRNLPVDHRLSTRIGGDAYHIHERNSLTTLVYTI